MRRTCATGACIVALTLFARPELFSQIPTKPPDSVKTLLLSPGMVRQGEVTTKDTAATEKKIARTSTLRTIERQTAPYAPKNASKVKKTAPTTK